jgi:hypothetical protein
LIAPIYVVAEKNDSIGFLKIALDDFARGLQIAMGIPDKDNLPFRGEMDQVRFFFQYLFNFLK